MRPVSAGCKPVSGSEIKQAIQLQTIICISEKRRIATKRVNVNKIKEIPLKITLGHDAVSIRMSHHISLLTLCLAHVWQNGPPALLVCVVSPHKIGFGLCEISKRPNAATAHCVEDTEVAFGFLVERGCKDSEVSSNCAFMAEEWVSCLEFDSSFGLFLGLLGWSLLERTSVGICVLVGRK